MSSVTFGALVLIVGAVSTVEERSFDSTNLERVVVKNARGEVEVVGGDVTKASIVANKRRFDDGCTLVMERSGDRLLAENRQENSHDDHRCEVDFRIVVPRGVDVQVAVGAGSVRSLGTRGGVEAKVGKGNVEIEGDVSGLKVAAGRGDINVRGLTSGGDVKAGKGSIELAFARAPSDGELSIRVGRGDATVYLPASSRIRARLVAGRGKLTNELGSDADARFRVSMKAGKGNLRILKR